MSKKPSEEKIVGLIGKVVSFDPDKGEKGEGLIDQIYPDKKRNDGKNHRHSLVGADYPPEIVASLTPGKEFKYEAISFKGPAGENWRKAANLEFVAESVVGVAGDDKSLKEEKISAKPTRVKISPEQLPSVYDKGAKLCVKTFNNAGEIKPESVEINSTGLITVKDSAKGGPVFSRDTQAARRVNNFVFEPENGSQNLIIEADDISTEITFTHIESGDTASITLNYR